MKFRIFVNYLNFPFDQNHRFVIVFNKILDEKQIKFYELNQNNFYVFKNIFFYKIFSFRDNTSVKNLRNIKFIIF